MQGREPLLAVRRMLKNSRDTTAPARLNHPPLHVDASPPPAADAAAAAAETGQSTGRKSPLPFGTDLHSILSLVGDAVISTDQIGNIILFNRAAEEIFGYDIDEVLGQPIELLIPMRFHERHREDIERFCSSLVPLRRVMGAGREVMGRRKDGSELAVEATLSRQLIGGLPIVTVVIRDVSDRKKAEIQRQVIANEVAHRLQNTMTTVNSIVALTARSATSVDEFKTALLGRYMAISRTNGFLIDSTGAATDLRQLLGSELAAFQDGEKIVLAGPDVMVGGDVAIDLALVVHELATNAVKYGSLSSPSGSLEVNWDVADDETPRLHLTWHEVGGPKVLPPTKRGFGSGLISRSMGRHGGSATLSFLTSGVGCDISCPLS